MSKQSKPVISSREGPYRYCYGESYEERMRKHDAIMCDIKENPPNFRPETLEETTNRFLELD